MNGWQRNGANPQWTTEQMMDALKRVYAKVGACGIAEYRIHRLPDDPTHQGIISRFGSWNRVKIKAGLPITIRTVKGKRTEEAEADEVELAPQPRTTYPCWKCRRDYQGFGRKQGDWFCESCRTTVREWAANMAWLG